MKNLAQKLSKKGQAEKAERLKKKLARRETLTDGRQQTLKSKKERVSGAIEPTSRSHQEG